jgi:hypothetical protein
MDRRFWAKNEGYFVLRLVKMARRRHSAAVVKIRFRGWRVTL